MEKKMEKMEKKMEELKNSMSTILLHTLYERFHKGDIRMQGNHVNVEDHIEHQQEVIKLLKDNLVTTQNRMKQQSYQYCREREFEVGDWVFFRLQPYKRMSLKNNKLSPKYYGPYKVLQRIGSMDYKLELPPYSHVHPIFQVS
jgi:hypothetical protein